MVGVGRDLCGSPSPTPLPKQGHLQQAVEDLVQARLEYLQRRRIHNPSGQPVPVLVTLRGKKFFLMFRRNFLCFSLCLLPLVLSLGTTEKSGPILLTLTFQIFISISKVPSQPSLLQAKQKMSLDCQKSSSTALLLFLLPEGHVPMGIQGVF